MRASEELRRFLSAKLKMRWRKTTAKDRADVGKDLAEARWKDNRATRFCPVCGAEYQSIRSLAAHRRKSKACATKRGRPKKSNK